MKSHLIQLGDIAVDPSLIQAIEPCPSINGETPPGKSLLTVEAGCGMMHCQLTVDEIMAILSSEKPVEPVSEADKELAYACRLFVESAHGNAEVAVNFVNHLQSIIRRNNQVMVEIPAIEDPEHNPDNVPPEKIPAGYRLARRSEVDNCFHEDSMYWDGNGCFRTQSKSKGCIRWKHNTIIIPINP